MVLTLPPSARFSTWCFSSRFMPLYPDTSGGAIDAQPSAAMPRLGWVTASWLVVLSLAVFLAAPSDAYQLTRLTGGQVWQGLMWGSVSVVVWMLASPPATAGRRLLSVMTLGVIFWWFHHCSGRPLTRYVISIGSFALLQLGVASILGWPGWSMGNQSLHAVQRYRFGIGGVMLVTAAIAVVLAATRSYDAPEEFFHGSRASAVGMVAIALAAQMSMLSRRRAPQWALATFASLGWTTAVLGSLHVLEVRRLQQPPEPAASIADLFDAASWLHYLLPLLAFAATVAMTALCGRLDREMKR